MAANGRWGVGGGRIGGAPKSPREHEARSSYCMRGSRIPRAAQGAGRKHDVRSVTLATPSTACCAFFLHVAPRPSDCRPAIEGRDFAWRRSSLPPFRRSRITEAVCVSCSHIHSTMRPIRSELKLVMRNTLVILRLDCECHAGSVFPWLERENEAASSVKVACPIGSRALSVFVYIAQAYIVRGPA